MRAPFPYFGGKSRIAHVVWQALGDVRNYTEPFAGSLAVLLERPESHVGGAETINDADGMVANFWRATSRDPDAVAHHADWPVNENDLHARHAWLVGQRERITAALDGDPDWYDAKAAGWWVWGICLWIGSGWCSGKGPWQVVDGQLVHLGNEWLGINRQLVHLGNEGRGINRQRVHLGNEGVGINRTIDGTTCADWSAHLRGIFGALRDRLRRVRVCCGDWSRVCSSTSTLHTLAPTGVFLDPPYTTEANRTGDLYAKDSTTVGHDVAAWCRAWGDDRALRIVLCGYDGEYVMPGWTKVPWRARKGYQGDGNDSQDRERLWLSPGCCNVGNIDAPAQRTLFDVHEVDA